MKQVSTVAYSCKADCKSGVAPTAGQLDRGQVAGLFQRYGLHNHEAYRAQHGRPCQSLNHHEAHAGTKATCVQCK